MPDRNCLICQKRRIYFYNSSKVLPEIKDRHVSLHRCLSHRHLILQTHLRKRRLQCKRRLPRVGSRMTGHFLSSVCKINLTIVLSGIFIRGFQFLHRLVGDESPASRRILQFQNPCDRRLFSVNLRLIFAEKTPAVPSLSEIDCQRIFPLPQQLRNLVCLIEHTSRIVGKSRRKHLPPDLNAV